MVAVAVAVAVAIRRALRGAVDVEEGRRGGGCSRARGVFVFSRRARGLFAAGRAPLGALLSEPGAGAVAGGVRGSRGSAQHSSRVRSARRSAPRRASQSAAASRARARRVVLLLLLRGFLALAGFFPARAGGAAAPWSSPARARASAGPAESCWRPRPRVPRRLPGAARSPRLASPECAPGSASAFPARRSFPARCWSSSRGNPRAGGPALAPPRAPHRAASAAIAPISIVARPSPECVVLRLPSAFARVAERARVSRRRYAERRERARGASRARV